MGHQKIKFNTSKLGRETLGDYLSTTIKAFFKDAKVTANLATLLDKPKIKGPVTVWGREWGSLTTSLNSDYALQLGSQHTSVYCGPNALGGKSESRVAANYFQNTAFGFAALQSSNGGSNNDAFGGWAMGQLQSGSENTAFGRDALGSLQNAGGNVALGLTAGYTTTTGGGNIFIGRRTGWGLQTGSSNIVIGDYLQGLPSALANTIMIGSTETRDNYFRIGRSSQSLHLAVTIAEYADNAAAKAANLVNGDIYRTGDILKVVHA